MGAISGFAPTIPVIYVEGEGFEMLKDADESITEDFKCLLLSDGKIMDDNFGVGLKKYLFENPDMIDYGSITTEIHGQVQEYLANYLKVLNIAYVTNKEDPQLPKEALVIKIQAQSKITGAPIPVAVFIDLEVGAASAETVGTTFTGNYHNWYLTER